MDQDLRARYQSSEYVIEDDPPIRFEIDETHQGLGLLGIEERARALGGRVDFGTQAHQGTSLEVVIPRRSVHLSPRNSHL